MQKVEVSRGLLIGLTSTAAAAVMGLVFLLGRESERGARVQDSPAPVMASSVTPIQAPDPVEVSPKGEQPSLPLPVPEAEALRKRSEALQGEEQALRRRYGVAAKL